jgi:hypothetical protein
MQRCLNDAHEKKAFELSVRHYENSIDARGNRCSFDNGRLQGGFEKHPEISITGLASTVR